MSTIRTVVLGNGFARTVVLPCLRHVPAIEVVGLASPNQERARATASAFGIPRVAADHRALLEELRPDLVFIVTPPHRHAEQAVDALQAGCHVVCEKPTAMNAEESRRMLEAADAAPGRISLLDHELRFDPRRVALSRLVEEGALGDILEATYIVESSGRRDPNSPWTWWSDAAQGGGALGALGSHAVDSLRSMMGEVKEARGSLHTFCTSRPDPAGTERRPVTSDDTAEAWIRFASGARATIRLSTVAAERVHRMTLVGTKGAARLDEQRPLLVSPALTEPLRGVTVDEDLPSSAELAIPDTDWARCFLRLSKATAAAIEAGQSTVPMASTFADGHANQRVLDAIRRSDRDDRWAEA